MRHPNRCAKVNVKVLVIVILVVVALGISLVAARQIRRSILSRITFEAGTTAFEKGDWLAAAKNLQEYLGRNPDDIEILRKYAQARLRIRPLEVPNLMQTIAGYRRILQLDPADAEAREELAGLYTGMRNFEDLAYIARGRLEIDPNDRKAPLWLATALIQLNKAEEARQTLEKFIAELDAVADKHPEYVQACAQMSQIVAAGESADARVQGLDWLNKAVEYAPDSVEALAQRAQFLRLTADSHDQAMQEQVLAVAQGGLETAETSAATASARLLELAAADLEAADRLGTQNPKLLYFLGVEWLGHGRLDRAGDELDSMDALPEEVLEEHFLDTHDWTVARFLLAAELSIRKGAAAECELLADGVLGELSQARHRALVLPSAINLYVVVGNASKARQYLDEYTDAVYAQGASAEAKQKLPHLRALVARAEGDSYGVIDALQPVVAVETANPEPWRLLAEAFSQTDQTRRAVDAMAQYLRLRPWDNAMMSQLAREYLRLQDWTRAFETARLAQSLYPEDVRLRLLRIETGIHLAAEPGTPDLARLEELDQELSDLRKNEDNAKRVDLRVLQAIIGIYVAQTETDADAKEQKLAEVERELRLAIEQCDEPLRAEMQLVRLYSQKKEMSKAIEECLAACRRHPDSAEPWLSLANLHVANGDVASAIRSLEEANGAVAGEWEKRSITIRWAVLELTRGNRAVGIRLLNDLAARDPREVRARTLLLDTREIRADQARTEELVQQLEQAEGQSGLMWRLYRAATWLSGDQWRSKQQGITDLLQACIDADPEWTAPPLLLAQLYEKLGDVKRVEEVCRQALVRNPSATAIADKLLTLLELQNRLSEADDIRRKVDADPRVVSAWNVSAALRSGDFSRAIDELGLRISNNERDVESRVLLARLLYWQTRDADQALKLLDEAEAIASPTLATTGVRAAILRAEGHADQATKILDQYVADKHDFAAYLIRAGYYVSQGQWELAEADYRQLTTVDPNQQVTGYALLSGFYARQNRRDEAITTLEEGLRGNPDALTLQRMLMSRLFARAQGQDRDRALAMLAALEERLPQDPDLMMVRTRELLRQGDVQSIQAAQSRLEEVVRLAPTAVDAHLVLVDLSMRAGQYAAARDYAIRALGTNPKHPALLSARGRAEIALGSAQIATELARQALAEDPNHMAALGVLVDSALARKDESLMKEAVRLARRIHQADPNGAEAINIVVSRAVDSREPALLDEAKGLIEAELARAPSQERLLLARAQLLVALGSPAEAIPELTAYCQSEKGRTSLDALVMLVDLHRLARDFEPAYAWLDRAAQVAPKSQTVVHARFLCLAAQSRWDDLAGISAAYIACENQDPAIVTRAAGVLASLDTPALRSEGVRLFEHAVKTWPTLPDARLGLASALYRTGDAEKAKQTYQELLDAYPNNTQVLNDLAWIIQEQEGDYEAALKLADRGLGLGGSDTDRRHLLDTRGTILSKIDRLSDARTDFEALLKLTEPGTAQRAKALLQLGRTCAKLGDVDSAKKHLQDALEIDRANPAFTPEERTEMERLLQQSGK